MEGNLGPTLLPAPGRGETTGIASRNFSDCFPYDSKALYVHDIDEKIEAHNEHFLEQQHTCLCFCLSLCQLLSLRSEIWRFLYYPSGGAEEWPVGTPGAWPLVLADAASWDTKCSRMGHPFPLPCRGYPRSYSLLPQTQAGKGGWHLGWWRVAGVRGWVPGAAGPHTGPKCGAGTGIAPQSGSSPLCLAAVGTQCPECPLPLGPSAVGSQFGWR